MTKDVASVAAPFNGLSPSEVERLALLLEEMGEAQQAIGKVLRHGYESTHPDGGPTNREALERELGDIFCAMDFLAAVGDVNDEEIRAWRRTKHKSVLAYLHHQEVPNA